MEPVLGDLVFFQRGYDITKAEQTPGDIPVVSSSGVNSYHSESRANGPGVVIGRKGSLGTIHFVDGPYWPHDTTLWSKDFKGNHPRFVYYFLHTLGLERYDVGNSNPTLNRNHIHQLPILMPEYHIQERIASTLSPYDDLLENNRRRIRLLERAARMVYKEWFVNLRFPGHEHVKIKDGVPEGWRRKHLSDLVNTQYGFTETATVEPIGPKFLRGTDINKASYIDWSTIPYCPEDRLAFRRYALKAGDIVVIRMADPGKVAIVETEQRAVFASYLVRLTVKSKDILPLFLFYVLSDDGYQGFISGASGGSTRKSASAKLLVNFNVLVPSLKLIRLFVEQVQPLRMQIQKILQQNGILRQAVGQVLPRLMNGKMVLRT